PKLYPVQALRQMKCYAWTPDQPSSQDAEKKRVPPRRQKKGNRVVCRRPGQKQRQTKYRGSNNESSQAVWQNLNWAPKQQQQRQKEVKLLFDRKRPCSCNKQ